MKALLLIILLLPLRLWGQADSTLKPIQFREAVEGYGRYLHGTRIYSYDGIDIGNPTQALKKYILAVRDSNATHEYRLFEENTLKLQAKGETFWTFFVLGTIEVVIGGIEAANYKKALDQQRQAYYSAPLTTPTLVKSTTPVTPTCACQCWTGISDGSGTIVYTCGSDYTIKTTNPYPSVGATNPTTPVTTPASTYPNSPPTTVDAPTGKGWLLTGLSTYVLGTIIAASGIKSLNPDLHFLRSVQYYNRALNRRISWQLQPVGGLNYSGVRLVGRF